MRSFAIVISRAYFEAKKRRKHAKNVQVSPVTMRRLGSTNLIRDIRETRTNEFRKKIQKKKKIFFFYNWEPRPKLDRLTYSIFFR